MQPDSNSNLDANTEDKLKDWSPIDRNHYEAAENCLAFDDWYDAMDELTQLSPPLWHHPAVLCAKSRAWALAHNWDLCARAATELCRVSPGFPSGWIRAAFALYKCDRTADARELLSSVVNKFPQENIIWWHLALYCFELDEFDNARKCVHEAIRRTGHQPQDVVTVSPELRPLCRWLAENKTSKN